MSRLERLRAAVEVAIILRQQVNVVDDDAAKVGEELARLEEANVAQCAAVEGLAAGLLHEEDLILDALAHQHRVKVLQKGTQVLLSVAIRHHDGHLVLRQAVLGLKVAAQLKTAVGKLRLNGRHGWGTLRDYHSPD